MIIIHLSCCLTGGYFQYQWLISDTVNYRSVWRKSHYSVIYNNNNVSFEGLDIYNMYYSYYRTRCNTSDNVCLNLHLPLFFIYIWCIWFICCIIYFITFNDELLIKSIRFYWFTHISCTMVHCTRCQIKPKPLFLQWHSI